ncbi:hypothetical protein AFIC_002091 [[Pseudomonas] carboxydohydrogena]|uniref:Uncharacterized protein n=1 Tax=Afipia carboxydohydrogena TaxID=290 RepID=A0ABY8BQ72_AFICR|nr:hypothetical protein [[Pseudomonas] carboxydohydrogena]WEF50547.1 hypothetical protein AFIC_002091 [[Pseudomonas] carboxydohydrogena]
MTTEVAVLNKFGVALAADSAVTVETYVNAKSQRKVHNTANKLFTLSKFEPVGIMLYNSVTLGGIPWETLIKVHRKQLFKTKYPALEDYAKQFFIWLNGGSVFDDEQTRWIVFTNLFQAFASLKSSKNSKAAFVAALNKEISELKKLADVEGFDAAFRTTVANTYRATIDDCAKLVFKAKASYLNGQKRKIVDFAVLLLTKQRRLDNYSGIVIAGFGENEMMPSLREYVVDIVVCGRVRFWLKDTKTIGPMNASEVVPLADDEVIRTLITGISPSFEDHVLGNAINLMISLPETILAPVSQLTAVQKQKYTADARKSLPQHFRDFYGKMTEHRDKNYTNPIKQAIASLSLSDLSAVAETFLSASQIQKRVNPDLETVGGPVDVAVISKGDGFVWVKRKHYFEERINPSFRLRYLEQ